MNPSVSIIMGSTSDLPVMKKAADYLDGMQIPFEMLALSAHRTPARITAVTNSHCRFVTELPLLIRKNTMAHKAPMPVACPLIFHQRFTMVRITSAMAPPTINRVSHWGACTMW